MDIDAKHRFLDHCRGLIGRHGHMVQMVDAAPFPYCYTIGLTPRLGAELLVVGLPQSVAVSTLNDLAARLKQESIPDDTPIHEVVNLPLKLRTVSIPEPASVPPLHQLLAVAFALDYRPTSVRQVLWPDPAGRFPADLGYASRCTQALDQFLDRGTVH